MCHLWEINVKITCDVRRNTCRNVFSHTLNHALLRVNKNLIGRSLCPRPQLVWTPHEYIACRIWIRNISLLTENNFIVTIFSKLGWHMLNMLNIILMYNFFGFNQAISFYLQLLFSEWDLITYIWARNILWISETLWLYLQVYQKGTYYEAIYFAWTSTSPISYWTVIGRENNQRSFAFCRQ